MIDKTNDIKSFITRYYEPSFIDEAELLLSSNEFLSILFNVFPADCIDTDDLYNILKSLGYEPQRKTVTEFVWCFRSIE